MKILQIYPLDTRSGSKVRSRGFYALLKSLGHDVRYMESNYSGDDPFIISIPQKNSLPGYFLACLRRLRHCLFMPYNILLIHKFLPVNIPCIIAAKLRGKKTVVDWDDLDFTYQPTRFRRTITRWAEHGMPRSVDLITTHNHGIKGWAEKAGARRVMIVPQAIDTNVFDSTKYDRAKIRRRLGIHDKKVICYLCTLDWGGARDLDKIISAVCRVMEKQADVVFLIIGGGVLEGRFRSQVSLLKTRGIIFTGVASPPEVAEYLAASDLALIYMTDDLGNRMRVSLKVLEYLSMEKPVVAHLVGPSKEYFAEYCVLSTGLMDDFSAKIIEALDAPAGAKDARKYIVEHHDWQVVKESIETALAELER